MGGTGVLRAAAGDGAVVTSPPVVVMVISEPGRS